MPPRKRTATVKAWIEAKPGAVATSLGRKGAEPLAIIYKVMGKMFAILSLRREPYVILKCHPHLATTLRQEYAGVGHRSHLDKRYWIAVTLEADVPAREIRRLISHSYELVCAGLTGKKKVELGRKSS